MYKINVCEGRNVNGLWYLRSAVMSSTLAICFNILVDMRCPSSVSAAIIRRLPKTSARSTLVLLALVVNASAGIFPA